VRRKEVTKIWVVIFGNDYIPIEQESSINVNESEFVVENNAKN
jgi:hypothetical protein